jgi:hypothetical protein
MCKIGDSKKKTNRIQNVGLAAPIQSSDRIEKGVKSIDLCTLGVRLESIYHDGLDVHF